MPVIMSFRISATNIRERVGANDWQENRGAWSNEQYQSFYRKHQYEYIMNTAEAAAAFGVTAGTMSPSQKARRVGCYQRSCL